MEQPDNPYYRNGDKMDKPTSNDGPESERPANPYLNPYQGFPAVDADAKNNLPPNPYQGNPYNPTPNSYQANPYGTPLPNPYQANPYSAPPPNSYPNVQPTPGYYQQQAAPATTTQQRVIRDPRRTTVPHWTYILTGIIAAVFVGQMVTGGGFDGSSIDKLLEAGAMVKSKVQAGEWWRLVTPIFLHFGVIHILFNSIALYAFGMQLEQLIGSRRFVLIFFLSGIAGNILALALQSGNTITAGASGAIFGLLGAAIGYFYRNREVMGAWGRSNLRSLLFTAGLNFVFTLSIPGISLGGHLGGILAGLALGYMLSPLQVRRTIGPGAESFAVRVRDFALEWWIVGAVIIVELLVLFYGLQGTSSGLYR